MEKESAIVKDAYYLINLFHRDKKIVTQWHIQKLMYLFEAYYMNVTDKSFLYEDSYKAWRFGTVTHKLYNKFKNYRREDIVLTEKEEKIGNNISEQKKGLMNHLYETFKDFSFKELVLFINAKGSAWDKAWNEKPYEEISKVNMKDWLKKYIKK